MMKHIFAFTLIGAVAIASAALASEPLKVSVVGIEHGKPVPEANVRCKPTAEGKSTDGLNQQPAILWQGSPKGTQSFAVFIMDPDVPADFTDAGKDGKMIAKDATRQDFFHYGVIDIPASATMLPGSDADKNPGYGIALINDMGLNKYVATQTAYGGPCPPFNDERVHHYHFIVMALAADAPTSVPCPNNSADPAEFCNTAKNTYNRLKASKSVLATGEVVGTYTLNPKLHKN